MSKPLDAINPSVCATVSASAGTGKTWLLVSRLIRLLLNGARPEGILAVTFTRKAAAEMQVRLNNRLREMAECSPQELDLYLTEIGSPLDNSTIQQAHTLYETLLTCPVTIKATTFHAFCQDILQRFPLEAGIPPGFELLESSNEFQQAAWDALCSEAGRHPDNEQAKAIETLFDACGGLDNTQTALNDFINHRSDWWAFTEGENHALSFAIDILAAQLKISPDENPQMVFFSEPTLLALEEFCGLLQKHANPTNQKHLASLSIARDPEKDYKNRFQSTCTAFLTQKGEPLSRKESKVQAKSMGEPGQLRFLKLHQQICEEIFIAQNKISAQLTLQRSTAWYQAGVNLLTHYQRLKAEQRVLDFSDLEWQAYRLLNHSDNVHWIQYKLDQRIDHLLIDEFQDTNPTQWRLILPLLQELAAAEDERGRTVFLVGDNKQSIYRFRRADPELFGTAQAWLNNNLNTVTRPLDTSWRSAQAIISLVNGLFGNGTLNKQLRDFTPHQTHHKNLWGQVELLPLVKPTEEAEPEPLDGLRNPLKTPRKLHSDQRHFEEGQMIAQRILDLMKNKTPIGAEAEARAIRYSDIMILIRHRTHADAYEQALRESGIPYNSANRGTLLESQEARDLVDLLHLLIAPYNNIALAGLLRSPLFDCSDNELITLGKLSGTHWIERLREYAGSFTEQGTTENPLHRAHSLLTEWRTLVDTLPVHDLLDRIFYQGDVLKRYQAAYPVHLQHRVVANLTRFIELALEVDSGRYPTIGHFVARLRALRKQEQDAPNEGTSTQLDARVSIMTIHGAKGLESPVVFLADSANTSQGKKAYRAVVDWPATAQRPECFFLAGKKDSHDKFTRTILDKHAISEERENANLFYVAVTRARQYLIISGSQPSRSEQLGWYGEAQSCLHDFLPEQDGVPGITSGIKPAAVTNLSPPVQAPPVIDPRLSQPVRAESTQVSIAPSQTTHSPDGLPQTSVVESDQQTRGIVIHRMLELLCKREPEETLMQRVASEYNLATDTHELADWYYEAELVFLHPGFSHIFSQENFQQDFNEVPVHFRHNSRNVHGIIDRVVVTAHEALVVDYKTRIIKRGSNAIEVLTRQYREQMQLYCEGAKRLWPDKEIQAGILFTHSKSLIMVDLNN